MQKRKPSAKDIAFEKERSQFRKTIREQDQRIKELEKQNDALKEQLREKDSQLSEKDDWIERLLEFANLSKEEAERLLIHQRTLADLEDHVKAFEKFFCYH